MLKRTSRLPTRKKNELIRQFSHDATAEGGADWARVNRNTANLWYRHLRELILARLSSVPILEGEIEIDHAYFGGQQRRKGSKGNRAWSTNKITVLGIMQRKGPVYVCILPNAKRESMMPIIKQVVAKGSTIYTDGWRGFATLSQEGYQHHAVNHSAGKFFDKNTGAHTGHIDQFWGFAKKRYLKFNGIPQHTFPLFIKECEFRHNHKKDDLSHILRSELKCV